MNKIYKTLSTLIILFILVLSFLYIKIFTPIDTKNYPTIIDIKSGENLSSITDKLYQAKIIDNKFIFENFVKTLKQDTQIKKGEYTFKKPLNTIEIVDKLINARYEYISVVITIKEGEDFRNITDTLYNNFKNISSTYTHDDLVNLIKTKEGYLFPETYNFPSFATIDDIFKKIDTEFNKRVVGKYNLPKDELNKILTIASILEKEVPHPDDMKIVSGIIQNRLKKNMPLQMDSTLGYFTGKASLELTNDDLKLDSPYNTYVNKGLPSGPIGNPGDVAIEAAMSPDVNDYLFFLSDPEGINHYAKSYDEHLKNRRMYLNK